MPKGWTFAGEDTARPKLPDGWSFEPEAEQAPLQAFKQSAVSGLGAVAKGVEAVAYDMPPADEFGRPTNPEMAANYERRMLQPKTAQLEEIKSGPAYEWGKAVQEAAKELYPISEPESRGVLTHIGDMAGGFLPLIASGPAAPLTIGLQSVGEHLEDEYQRRLAKGATPEEAADQAINGAMRSGAVQATLFEVLPAPLRKLGDKFVENFARTTFTKFLAGRAAQAGEGAALGGATQAADNAALGHPIDENVATGAAGLGLMQSILPRGAARDTGRNVPESAETLRAQQEQLLAGRRPAQMFPTGTAELPLPEGMERVETERGVFHYNPDLTTADAITKASAAGRENDVLALGDQSKADVEARAAAGDQRVAVTERSPAGAEVKTSLATAGTAADTAKALEASKTPGNTVQAEPVGKAVSQRPDFVGDLMATDLEQLRSGDEAAAKEKADREQRQAELDAKKARFDETLNAARSIATGKDANFPALNGALQAIKFYAEDNSVGLTEQQRDLARKATAVLEQRTAAVKPTWDAAQAQNRQATAAAQAAATEAQRAARATANQDFKAEVAAGKSATGAIDYGMVTDDRLAELAQQGDKQAEQTLMRRGAAQPDERPTLLNVLERVKLPSRDEALQGELNALREEMSGGKQARFFSNRKGGLDRVAEALREKGFSWIKTPADVIDAAQRALRGEDIRADHSGEADFAKPVEAKGEPLTDTDADREMAAIRKAFPALTRDYDIEVGLVEDAMRRRGYTGQIPKNAEAAVLRLKAQRNLIVIGARSYRDRAKGAGLLTHEVAHTYWNTLPEETRAQLRDLHTEETSRKSGPLYRDGALQSDLQHVEELDERGHQEWFAERIARLNEAWAKGQIDRTEHSLLVRIAHQLRAFLRHVWSTIAESSNTDPESELFVTEFRRFLAGGADEAIGRQAGANYAAAQSTLDLGTKLGIALPPTIRNLQARWQEKPLVFTSSLDKALYYAGGEGNTQVRDGVVASLTEQTGLSSGQIATLARSLRERLLPLTRSGATNATIRVPALMDEAIARQSGVDFAKTRIDKTAKPEQSAPSEDARQYVEKNGTKPEKQAAAEADIARVLSVAEDEQLDLFAYGTGPESVRAGRPDRTPGDRLTNRERTAEALRNPTNPEKIREGFGKGDRISSILPELVRDPTKGWDIRGAVVKSARDFATFVQILRTPYVEVTKLAFVNADGVVVHSEIMGIGSTTQAIMAPSSLAHVMSKLPREGKGLAVIMSHNHPSGDPSPSAADMHVTRLWDQAARSVGIAISDHVITNGESYFSFREAGMLNGPVEATSRAKPAAVGADVPAARPLGTPAPWEAIKRNEATKANGDAIRPIVGALRQVTPDALHVLFLSHRGGILAIERIPNADRIGIEEIRRRIFTGAGSEGATGFIVDAPTNLSHESALSLMRNLREFSTAANLAFVDFSSQQFAEGKTARQMGLVGEPAAGEASHAVAESGDNVDLQSRFEKARTKFDELTAEVDRLKVEIAKLGESQEPDVDARGRALQAEMTAKDAQAKATYTELDRMRAEIEKQQPSASEIVASAPRVEGLPKVDRQAALIAELQRGREMLRDGIRTGNERASTQGNWIVKQARERLDDEFPGWEKPSQNTTEGQRPEQDSSAQPGPVESDVTDREKSPFRPDEEETMPIRKGKFDEVYGQSAYQPNAAVKTWRKFRDLVVGIKGSVPELPTFPSNQTDQFTRQHGREFYNPVREFYRAIKSGNDYVQRTAEDDVSGIVRKLIAAGGRFNADDYAQLQKRQEQVRRLQADKKPVPAGVRAEIAALNSKMEGSPYVLFNRLVLALDLKWRQQNLKDSEGNPIRLPGDINPAEVKAELQRLSERLEASPHADLIKQAVQQHMALVRCVADDLKSRELLASEHLANPYYFPHVTLETTRGGKTEQRELTPTKVRPGTEADFRGYLIDPVGSNKAIETDYVRAMYYHLVQVGAHNLKADAVRDYLRPFDIMAKVLARAKQLSQQRGLPVSWEQAFHEDFAPRGYVLYGTESRDAFPSITVDRDRLARRLGVMLTSEDLHRQLASLGMKGVKLLPEDLRESLQLGGKETWIVPATVAEAMRGIAEREGRRDNAIEAAAKWTLGKWKAWKLFMPWNHVRYEFGNVVADLEKLFSADPRTFKYLAPAAGELRDFWRGGKASDDLRAAIKEGVINAVTAQEMNHLTRLRAFEAFQTRAQRAWNTFKQRGSSILYQPVTSALGLGDLSSPELSALREAVTRYSKFKADLEAIRNGARPHYAGAYWKDIEAMSDSAPGANDAAVRKAAAISKATFGDYGDVTVLGQALRDKMIPFYSWTEINFRYHANLFRNLRDMVRAGELGKIEAAGAGAKAAAGFTARVASGVMLRLAAPYFAVYIWNNTGDRDDYEQLLSEEDRRRFHVILGEKKDGNTTLRDGRKIEVVYGQTAFMDVAKWFSGPRFAQSMAGWLNGKTDFPTAISAWRDSVLPDQLNNLASSAGPLFKIPYTAIAKKNPFPDITDQRTVPSYDMRRVILGQVTDDFVADQIERLTNKDYYGSKDLGDWAKQLILQVRQRDPEQWAFYEVKDKANDFLQKQTGQKRDTSYDAPDQQVLRNFRRAIYRGDLDKATQFYLRLLDYGYTAERFADSIRAQDPLSVLPKDLRRPFLDSLDQSGRDQVSRAYQFYERMAASRGREAQLFPRDRTGAAGVQRYQANPQVNRLGEMMDRVGGMSDAELQRRAQIEQNRSLKKR